MPGARVRGTYVHTLRGAHHAYRQAAARHFRIVNTLELVLAVGHVTTLAGLARFAVGRRQPFIIGILQRLAVQHRALTFGELVALHTKLGALEQRQRFYGAMGRFFNVARTEALITAYVTSRAIDAAQPGER